MHSATAMQFITNQNVGEDADPWLVWWEKNKSKCQTEWISDGFAQRGIKADVPPTADQIPALLMLLGSSESEHVDCHNALKYNAFRCLRDSGFDPVEFALSHPPLSKDVKQGLAEYRKAYGNYPEEIRIGILPLRTNDATRSGPISAMVTPEYQISANLLAFVPIAIGAILLAWSLRKKKLPTDQKAAGTVPTADHTSVPSPATSPRHSDGN